MSETATILPFADPKQSGTVNPLTGFLTKGIDVLLDGYAAKQNAKYAVMPGSNYPTGQLDPDQATKDRAATAAATAATVQKIQIGALVAAGALVVMFAFSRAMPRGTGGGRRR